MNSNNNFAFWKALKEGDACTVQKWLRSGTNANEQDAWGRSALCVAVGEKQWHCVRILQQYGADINTRNCDLNGKGRRTNSVSLKQNQVIHNYGRCTPSVAHHIAVWFYYTWHCSHQVTNAQVPCLWHFVCESTCGLSNVDVQVSACHKHGSHARTDGVRWHVIDFRDTLAGMFLGTVRVWCTRVGKINY